MKNLNLIKIRIMRIRDILSNTARAMFRNPDSENSSGYTQVAQIPNDLSEVATPDQIKVILLSEEKIKNYKNGGKASTIESVKINKKANAVQKSKEVPIEEKERGTKER